jgi:hypothetical protein
MRARSIAVAGAGVVSPGLRLPDRRTGTGQESVSIQHDKERIFLENEYVRARNREDGRLYSLFDKRAGRDSIALSKRPPFRPFRYSQ